MKSFVACLVIVLVGQAYSEPPVAPLVYDYGLPLVRSPYPAPYPAKVAPTTPKPYVPAKVYGPPVVAPKPTAKPVLVEPPKVLPPTLKVVKVVKPQLEYGVPLKPVPVPKKPVTVYGPPIVPKPTAKPVLVEPPKVLPPTFKVVKPQLEYGVPLKPVPTTPKPAVRVTAPALVYGPPKVKVTIPPPKPAVVYGPPTTKKVVVPTTPKPVVKVTAPALVYGPPKVKVTVPPPKPAVVYGPPTTKKVVAPTTPKPVVKVTAPALIYGPPKVKVTPPPKPKVVVPHQVYGVPEIRQPVISINLPPTPPKVEISTSVLESLISGEKYYPANTAGPKLDGIQIPDLLSSSSVKYTPGQPGLKVGGPASKVAKLPRVYPEAKPYPEAVYPYPAAKVRPIVKPKVVVPQLVYGAPEIRQEISLPPTPPKVEISTSVLESLISGEKYYPANTAGPKLDGIQIPDLLSSSSVKYTPGQPGFKVALAAPKVAKLPRVYPEAKPYPAAKVSYPYPAAKVTYPYPAPTPKPVQKVTYPYPAPTPKPTTRVTYPYPAPTTTTPKPAPKPYPAAKVYPYPAPAKTGPYPA